VDGSAESHRHKINKDGYVVDCDGAGGGAIIGQATFYPPTASDIGATAMASQEATPPWTLPRSSQLCLPATGVCAWWC